MIIDVTEKGASPNQPDSTDYIQKALDAASPGDTVYVPPVGDFLIDATRGVLPKSGTNFKIAGNLRAIPNDQTGYSIVTLRGIDAVSVLGPGKIIGERYAHTVTAPGRWGFCLSMWDSSNVQVQAGLTLTQGWADGIYVQGCKKVTVDGVTCSDNARNGMSIIAVETMSVTNSIFAGTHSEAPYPQAGIDIEPDVASQSLLDISITRNQFNMNKGAGCYIGFEKAAANRTRIFVVNNQFNQHYKDGSGPPLGGRNTWLCNLLYATCRWMPGYDYWAWPTEFTAS